MNKDDYQQSNKSLIQLTKLSTLHQHASLPKVQCPDGLLTYNIVKCSNKGKIYI